MKRLGCTWYVVWNFWNGYGWDGCDGMVWTIGMVGPDVMVGMYARFRMYVWF